MSCKQIQIDSFGKVIAPIQVDQSSGKLETYIEFDGDDLATLIGAISYGFYGTNYRTRTQRQKDIIEYCTKLYKLLSKEKNVNGYLVSPITQMKKLDDN